MMLFYAPVLVILLFTSLDLTQYFNYGIPVGVTGLLTYLLSQLGRDRGKKIEVDLWANWGGAPTTQLFRWRNSIIDQYSKARYHAKMEQLSNTGQIVDVAYESNNPQGADEVYKAWTKLIITNTRDTSKYHLIFKENMAYGFRRNLLGLKPFAIVLIIILAISIYMYSAIMVGDWRISCLPLALYMGEVLLLVLAMFWIFVVNQNWVSLPAFAYAERLHEAIDSL